MSFMEIGFELTNDCNLDCLHCLRERDDRTSFLPIPLVRKVLREAKAYGTVRVGFTGGEATLHPDFLGVVDAVTGMGYPYFFITNGMNFQRVFPQICEGKTLRKSLLLGVSLSLDGAREETHDALRGKGSFKKAIRAAMYLRQKKVPLTIQMVVNKRNAEELDEMARLAHDLNARRLYYAPLLLTRQILDRGLALTPDECRKISAKVDDLKERMKVEIHHSVGWHEPLSFFQCRALQMEQINIDYKGRLTFCCNLSGSKGSDGRHPEIIADLRKTSLHRGLRLLYERIAEFNKKRLSLIGKKQMTTLDHYPCYYCDKHFGKLKWLKAEFPESPWA